MWQDVVVPVLFGSIVGVVLSLALASLLNGKGR